MNKVERIKAIKAMEFLARQINDEEIFESWLIYGIADGDIEYGDLSIKDEDFETYGTAYYAEDKNFAELMNLFLRIMARAKKSGGLYCDGITDKAQN